MLEDASAPPDYAISRVEGHGIVSAEANTGNPLRGEFERMARRRFQDPKPQRRGDWWVIQVRQDVVVNGTLKRSNKRVRLAPVTMSEREVRKVAAEYMRPLNQGMQGIGSATSFAQYVQQEYMQVVMPLLAKSTRDRYEGVLKNYLLPTFGELCLRDLSPLSVQKYFSNMATSPLAHESRDKIRDVLSRVLASAVKYEFLVRNSAENMRMPAEKRGKKRNKPYLSSMPPPVIVRRTRHSKEPAVPDRH